jgi:hypothetical protein
MSLWTTKVVRPLLSPHVGIASGRERVRQGRQELGVRLRRLRHRHLQAQSEAQAAFRAELEGVLQDWPEEGGGCWWTKRPGVAIRR